MNDLARAYRDARLRMTDLFATASPDQLAAPVPATPDWRVRDVAAHLSGVTADIVDGALDGVGTDVWTARQVEARNDRSIDDILDEWQRHSVDVEQVVDRLGPGGKQLLADVASHEHDVRGALGVPGARDSDAVVIGFEFFAFHLGRALDRAGAPALRVRHEGGEVVLGDAEPGAAVEISRFELLRAATGRRSLDQLTAYRWSGDAHPELLVMRPLFTMRPTPLAE